MGHTCPECGCVCYCRGDIDDIIFDIPKNGCACDCWMDDEPDDTWDYLEDDPIGGTDGER